MSAELPDWPWSALGLSEPTHDVVAIRRAYAKLLKSTRPDDDAQAYQDLRRANDAALEWARLAEFESAPTPINDEGQDDESRPYENGETAIVAELAPADPIDELPFAASAPSSALAEAEAMAESARTRQALAFVQAFLQAPLQCVGQGEPQTTDFCVELESALDDLPLELRTQAGRAFAEVVAGEMEFPSALALSLADRFGWLQDYRQAQALSPELLVALQRMLRHHRAVVASGPAKSKADAPRQDEQEKAPDPLAQKDWLRASRLVDLLASSRGIWATIVAIFMSPRVNLFFAQGEPQQPWHPRFTAAVKQRGLLTLQWAWYIRALAFVAMSGVVLGADTLHAPPADMGDALVGWGAIFLLGSITTAMARVAVIVYAHVLYSTEHRWGKWLERVHLSLPVRKMVLVLAMLLIALFFSQSEADWSQVVAVVCSTLCFALLLLTPTRVALVLPILLILQIANWSDPSTKPGTIPADLRMPGSLAIALVAVTLCVFEQCKPWVLDIFSHPSLTLRKIFKPAVYESLSRRGIQFLMFCFVLSPMAVPLLGMLWLMVLTEMESVWFAGLIAGWAWGMHAVTDVGSIGIWLLLVSPIFLILQRAADRFGLRVAGAVLRRSEGK